MSFLNKILPGKDYSDDLQTILNEDTEMGDIEVPDIEDNSINGDVVPLVDEFDEEAEEGDDDGSV